MSDELDFDSEAESRHILDSARAVPLADLLTALTAASHRFSVAELTRFSLLAPDELPQVFAAFTAMPEERRAALIEDLDDLAQSSYLVDFSAFFTQALKDPAARVRRRAIHGLLDSEEENIVPHLLRLLRDDDSQEVQAQAAEALGGWVEMGELEEMDAALYAEVHAGLVAALEDNRHNLVRRRALEALGFSAAPAVTAAIEAALARPDEDWLTSALLAIGRSAQEQWQSVVLEQLDHANVQVRLEAARAAGALECEEAVPALLTLLEDDDDEVRLAAAWALSQTGGEGTREGLEAALERAEDEAEIEFIENTLEFLRFNQSAGDFDLFALDPDIDDFPIADDED